METPISREISGHTACVLPNLMPFGSYAILVRRSGVGEYRGII
jgi:hypothetical protein